MSHYAQNNFKESNIAKEGESNKTLMIVTIIATICMFAAFKYAIGA